MDICYLKARSTPFQVCNFIEVTLLSRSTTESTRRFELLKVNTSFLICWCLQKGSTRSTFFFMTTTIIKEEKRGRYSFSPFYLNLSFFSSRQNEQLHRIPLLRFIHSSSNSNSMFDFFSLLSLYSKGNRSLRRRKKQ